MLEGSLVVKGQELKFINLFSVSPQLCPRQGWQCDQQTRQTDSPTENKQGDYSSLAAYLGRSDSEATTNGSTRHKVQQTNLIYMAQTNFQL